MRFTATPLALALAAFALAPASSAQSIQSSPVLSTSSTQTFDRSIAADSLYYDNGDEERDSNLGFGDGRAFRAAVRFTADAEFQLDEIKAFFRTETFDPSENGPIALEVYDGAGADPSGSALLASIDITEVSPDGAIYVRALDTPITFAAGEDFFLAVNFPAGMNFPMGTDDDARDGEQRSFFSETGDSYTALPDIIGDGTPDAFFIRALSNVIVAAEALPAAVTSVTAFPNPTASSATLAIELTKASDVRATVYDVLGRQVADLHEGLMAAGRTPLAIDAASLAPGTYVARIEVDGAVVTRQLTVVR